MAQIMDPNILQSSPGPDALPERLEVAQSFAGQGADDDPWVIVDAFGRFE